jgi:hypothetical protein
MDFLQQPLSITLVDAAVHNSWFAKVFDGRPKDSMADQQAWSAKIQQDFDKVVDTPSKPIGAASLLIDAHGAFLVVSFSKNVNSTNAKSVVRNLLSGIPEKVRNDAVGDLHPLDEVDKERIEAMRIFAACAPPAPKRRRREFSESTEQLLKSTGPSLASKIDAYAADVASDSDEEQALPNSLVTLESKVLAIREQSVAEEVEPRVLRAWGRLVLSKLGQPELTGVRSKCWLSWDSLRKQHNRLAEQTLGEEEQLSLLQVRVDDTAAIVERLDFYKVAVVDTAAIVVATSGVEQLTYRRCYLDSRRELLLVKRLGKNPTLLQVVCMAVGMAEVGQLPLPGAGKQKSEFLKRCRKVLLNLQPTASVIVKDLPMAEQIGIAMALGSEKRLCPCTKPAKIAFPQASWIWTVYDGVPELTNCFEAFCSQGCIQRHRPKYCPGCLKDDALVPKWRPMAIPGNGYTANYCTRCGCFGRQGLLILDLPRVGFDRTTGWVEAHYTSRR